MRFSIWALLGAFIVALIVGVQPVGAQFLTFHQGAYEFESYIPNIIWNGTWTTTTAYSNTVRSTTASGSWTQFPVVGKTLIIWRLIRATGQPSSMNVCTGLPISSCTLVSNTSVHPDGYFESYIVPLSSGTNYITIEWASGGIFLDKFIVLSDSQLYLTSVVPTATAVPTSTPVNTPVDTPTPMDTPVDTPTPMDTPVDTPTAVLTATPYTLPDAVYAIEPDTSYTTVNGQIVAISYRFTAGEVAIIVLLAFLSLVGIAFLVLRMGDR